MRAPSSWGGILYRAFKMVLGVAPAEDYRLAARGLIVEGNSDAALRVLERGALRHPEHYALQLDLAMRLRESDQTDSALSAFLDAAVADPTASAPHVQMARLFADEGNWEAMAEACRAALSLNPGDTEMKRGLDDAEARGAEAPAAENVLDEPHSNSPHIRASPAPIRRGERRISGGALDAFSESYLQAREKFLAGAKACNVSVRSYMNPASGPEGEALWTDALVLGAENARRVLVANSATHGGEGFCGSAALVGWLHEQPCHPPDGVKLVLIHAINPYGFAWLRRVTEENVDLNRNFLTGFDDPPANPDYATLHEGLLSGNAKAPDWGKARAVLDGYAERHGAFAMQGVLSRGQYSHPDGLFYGGSAPGWSNRTFRAILDDMVRGAEHIAFIDFHTGLGPFGHAELISKCAMGDPELERLVRWFGPAVRTSSAGESSSPMLSGLIAGAVRDLEPSGTVSAITAEFGTYPLWDVLRALQEDNWLHVRGRVDSPEGERIKRNFKEMFYPDRDDWRELVLVRSRQLIRNALAGLSSL